jgi:two-component system chemotaxis response regulator CheY
MSRILAVDDSASMRNLVRTTVTAAGFELELASDGENALAMARESHFDLVLADLNMPNMDGMALIRALRAEEAYRHVPILMLTTESSKQAKLDGKAAGATGWIVKPFDPKQLLRTLQRVLE